MTKTHKLGFAAFSVAIFSMMMTSMTISSLPDAYADGTLFVGADVEEFAFGIDQIGIFTTTGGVAVGAPVPLGAGDFANGMTVIGPNQLLTGTVGIPFAPDAATATTVKIRDFSAVPGVSLIAAIPTGAFNEDYAYDGTSVWHTHFINGGAGSVIQLDPNNLDGPALSVHNLDFGPVGATVVDGQLWISNWSGQTFGTFDPNTDTYTPMLATSGTSAGCLAFDSHSRIIWGGEQGGLLVPYDADTLTPINAGFQPFGPIGATVDGCAFWSPFGGEKTWTHTDYNWDQVCDGFVNPEDNLCYEDELFTIPMDFRPANINNVNDDVLADPLDQDGDDKYLAFAQVHNNNKFSNTNPGAFYALTTVDVTYATNGLMVTENYNDCTNPDGDSETDDGILQFVSQKIDRNVKVAIAAPNGDVTELTGDLYSGVGGSISADIDQAVVLIDQDIPAGSTAYVLVKFQDNLKGFDTGDGVFDDMCDNSEVVEAIYDGADNESHTFDASLRITNVP